MFSWPWFLAITSGNGTLSLYSWKITLPADELNIILMKTCAPHSAALYSKLSNTWAFRVDPSRKRKTPDNKTFFFGGVWDRNSLWLSSRKFIHRVGADAICGYMLRHTLGPFVGWTRTLGYMKKGELNLCYVLFVGWQSMLYVKSKTSCGEKQKRTKMSVILCFTTSVCN